MKRLLRLYPRAWRARYQAEVRALLDASPGGWRDALDLIVGAIDARLYPQTAGYGGRRWTRALGVVCLAALGVCCCSHSISSGSPASGSLPARTFSLLLHSRVALPLSAACSARGSQLGSLEP